jgi:aspartyl/asparaginyl beta-hydroxylase (cupin superfamily)
MLSIYQVSKIAVVAAISTSMLLSVSSLASASELTANAESAAPSTISAEAHITRSEARKIVNEYLKSNGKRNLRAGRTSGDGEYWSVKIATPMGVDAGAMRVDRVSGELSKS